jgi:pyruvate,water dikinase
MDIEWAKDGGSGDIFIVQARPETVQSSRRQGLQQRIRKGRKLVTGLSIGGAVVAGPVCIIRDPKKIDRFPLGGVLVTTSTNPDWVPIRPATQKRHLFSSKPSSQVKLMLPQCFP